MPKMQIVKTKHINAPVSKVYEIVHDMSSWSKWSPWLIMDPDAIVEVAEDNRSYSWEGNRVGSGHMSILEETPNKSVDYDLTFLKPWKSKAKVRFETKEKDGGTEVSWHMDSSLPWFMFWMKKMMVAFVGQDYDRGLSLLKDFAEDGEIHSKLNWLGERQFPGCDYIGISRTCSIDEMGVVMKSDFENLMEYAKGVEGADVTKSFSMYHKFDFVKNMAKYTAGIPSPTIPSDLPSEFKAGNIPPTKIYTVEHIGPYAHLGNAWTTIYTMHRNKEIKGRKGIHPFETYGNSPADTDPNDLITHINFAVK
ncbi:MAG: SRPBCC family protein [Saprospiraceae bacterium]|nr:SRPBCC family protein [Saprospiraceae bacterium]